MSEYKNGTTNEGSGMSPWQIAALEQTLRKNKQLDMLTKMMNAAGNPTRMSILYLLWRNGEVRVNDLANILRLTSPAISQQLKKLRSQSLVDFRRDAQTVFYRLNLNSAFVQHFLVRFFEQEMLFRELTPPDSLGK
jgi:DNA-binding transcriptional ArsR family regulator